MRAVDIIIKKRDQFELSKEEIEFFVPLYNGIKKQIEEIHSNFG